MIVKKTEKRECDGWKAGGFESGDTKHMAEKKTVQVGWDVIRADENRQRRRLKKIKECWRWALWRMLKLSGKVMRSCEDQDLVSWSSGVNYWDAIFKEQMEEEFPEEYPLGSSFQVIGFQELQDYLRSELTKFISRRTSKVTMD